MDQDIILTTQSPLEKVQKKFEDWRKNRKTRKPIPKSLWKAAIDLHGEYTIHQITKTLRLNYTDFKRKVYKTEKLPIMKSDPASSFIEVDLNQYIPKNPEYSIEVETPEGSKMKISVKDQGVLDIMVPINQFWKQCR